MEDTQKTEEKPILLSELLKLAEKCEEIYGQTRVYQRVKALVMGELVAFGRHTITQLLLFLGLVENDWRTWYCIFSEKRYDEAATSRMMRTFRVERWHHPDFRATYARLMQAAAIPGQLADK